MSIDDLGTVPDAVRSGNADLLIGLDSGTQSAKALVCTLGGERVSAGTARLAIHVPCRGWAEQDPEDWWRSVRAAIREAVTGIDASRIRGLYLPLVSSSLALSEALEAIGGER